MRRGKANATPSNSISVRRGTELDISELAHPVHRHVLGYVLAWVLGGSLDRRQQSVFDMRLRELGALEISESSSSIYNSFVDMETGALIPCTGDNVQVGVRMLQQGFFRGMDEPAYDDAAFTGARQDSFFFPTGPSLALQHVLVTWLAAGRPALLVGPPGSGKTEILTRVMRSDAAAQLIYLPLSSDMRGSDLCRGIQGGLERRRPDLYTNRLGSHVPILLDDLHIFSVRGAEVLTSAAAAAHGGRAIPEKDCFEPTALEWLRSYFDNGVFLSEDGTGMFQVPRVWLGSTACRAPIMSGPFKMSERVARHWLVANTSEWSGYSSTNSLFTAIVCSPLFKACVQHNLGQIFAEPTQEESHWLMHSTEAILQCFLDLGTRISTIFTPDEMEIPRALYPNLRCLSTALQDMVHLLDTQMQARRTFIMTALPKISSAWVYTTTRAIVDRVQDPGKAEAAREAIVSVAVKYLAPIDRGLIGAMAVESENSSPEYLAGVALRGYAIRSHHLLAPDSRMVFESVFDAVRGLKDHQAFSVEASVEEAEPTCFKRSISRLLLPGMASRVFQMAYILQQQRSSNYVCLAGTTGCGKASLMRMACALADMDYVPVSSTLRQHEIIDLVCGSARSCAVDGRRVVLAVHCKPGHLTSLLPLLQLLFSEAGPPLYLQQALSDLMRRTDRGVIGTRSPPPTASESQAKGPDPMLLVAERLRVVFLLDTRDIAPMMRSCPALMSRGRLVVFGEYSSEDLVTAAQMASYNMPLLASGRAPKEIRARGVGREDGRASGKKLSGRLKFIHDQFDQQMGRDIDLQKLAKLAVLMHESAVAALTAAGMPPGCCSVTKLFQMLATFSTVLDMHEQVLRDSFVASKWAIEEMQHLVKVLEDLREQDRALAPILSELVSQANALMIEINVLEHEKEDSTRKFEFEQAKVDEALSTIQDLMGAAEADVKLVESRYRACVGDLTGMTDNDLYEVRAYMLHSPPALVKTVMMGVLCALGIAEDWDNAKKLLMDTERGLLTRYAWISHEPCSSSRPLAPDLTLLVRYPICRLSKFDVNSVGERRVAKLKRHLDNPLFKPAAVAQVSKALRNISEWVIRVFDYASVKLMVEEKASKIREGRAKIDKAKEHLEVRHQTVVALTSRIKAMKEEHDSLLEREKRMEREMNNLRENMSTVEEALEFLHVRRSASWSKLVALHLAGSHSSFLLNDSRCRPRRPAGTLRLRGLATGYPSSGATPFWRRHASPTLAASGRRRSTTYWRSGCRSQRTAN